MSVFFDTKSGKPLKASEGKCGKVMNQDQCDKDQEDAAPNPSARAGGPLRHANSSSTNASPERQTQSLQILSALSQETRLEAFRLLSRSGEKGLGAGQIAKALAIRHNTLSTHLAILQRAGLIRSEREGRNMIYYMVPSSLGAMMSFLLDNCCDAMPEKCLSPDFKNPSSNQ